MRAFGEEQTSPTGVTNREGSVEDLGTASFSPGQRSHVVTIMRAVSAKLMPGNQPRIFDPRTVSLYSILKSAVVISL